MIFTFHAILIVLLNIPWSAHQLGQYITLVSLKTNNKTYILLFLTLVITLKSPQTLNGMQS